MYINQNNYKIEDSKTGSGVTGALFIVFLVLKLTGVIDWSWWWVTSPIWSPVVIAIGLAIILLIFTLIMVFIGRKSLSDVKSLFKK